MKNFLRVVGILLIILVVFLLAAFSYVQFGMPNVKDAPALNVEITPERLERGKYLATSVMGCMDCHAQRDFTKYTAPVIAGTEGAGGEKWSHEGNFPGTMYAPNITPYALKDWTDGEIYRAITMGVDKEGNALFPIMPYINYGKLPDEDIYSVIAYLRTLDPIENTVPERELDFPLSLIVNTIPQEQEKMIRPHPSEKVAYGKYILTAASCNDCHTPQENGQYIKEKYMAGGFEFPLPNGIVVTSSNLTPHPDFGIGNWDVNTFVQRFNNFRDSAFVAHTIQEGEYNTIMPWTFYSRMNEEDLRAVFAYLQTLEPVENPVNKFKVVSK